MELFAQQIFHGLGDTEHIIRVFARLSVAMILGGWVGAERYWHGKVAGVRTHAIVALGTALFVIVPREMELDVSRVIQGVAAGIGFLGAGAILKITQEHTVEGLTTAATIWLTAAVGMAVGGGWLWPAVITVLLSSVALRLGAWVEHLLKHGDKPQ